MASWITLDTAGVDTTGADTPTARIAGYRAEPDGPPRGGLVVIQEIFGVNAHIRSVVERFAQHGYAALAPALFDSVEAGVALEYDAAGVARGRELTAKLGLDTAVAGVRAAADALAGSGKVGAIGFCWGGSIAFLANTRLGLPAVSYYGGRSVPLLGETTRAPMLFHFGERDPIISAGDVRRHRDAQPDAEIHVWPAGHGFNCDQRADFDPASAAAAMEKTLAFFARTLR